MEDYSKEKANDEFENYVLDISYQIENGLDFFNQKFFKNTNHFKILAINKA